MKRSLSVVCMLAAMTAMGYAAVSPAQSAEPPSAPLPAGTAAPAGPSKVAVIGFEQAVVATNEGRRMIAQIQAKYAPKEAALKTEKDQIDALQKELQGNTLTEAERATRSQTLDEKTKNFQREAQDDENDENSDMQDAFTALSQKVGAVLESYAQEHGYTLVLDGTQPQSGQSPILWVSPETDITKAVVDAYNAKSGVAAPAAISAPAPARTTPRSTSTTHTTRPQ